MKGFKIAVYMLALLPIVTGLMDILVGVSAWQTIGVALTETGFGDSVLDNQVRFLGVVWVSFGCLIIICLSDIDKYKNLLRGTFLVVFIGGIARLYSLFNVGLPESAIGQNFIVFALTIELVLMPFLLYWQSKVIK